MVNWVSCLAGPETTSCFISYSELPSTHHIKTLPTSPGNFDVFFYYPSGFKQETAKEAQYPIVIVPHGGGWCVGHGRNDERFISTLTTRGAVVAAVNYRLAPENPYPAPLSDCLDAILHIWKNATATRLDKHRTFIAGFSVGGQMAFASLFMLWKALRDDKEPRIDPATLGTMKGITAFYPPMDLTKTRPQRAASNPAFVALKKKKPVSSSKFIGDIFDRAYFWKLREIPDKGQMFISLRLAPPDVVKTALPERISSLLPWIHCWRKVKLQSSDSRIWGNRSIVRLLRMCRTTGTIWQRRTARKDFGKRFMKMQQTRLWGRWISKVTHSRHNRSKMFDSRTM